MICPRRDEGMVPSFVGPEDSWRDDGSCSYCGSLNPDVLMARVEAGDVELGPTDKNYKVYVRNAGGAPFRQTFGQAKRDHVFPADCPLCQKPLAQKGAPHHWCGTCDCQVYGGDGGDCPKCKVPLRSSPQEVECRPCALTLGRPTEMVTRDASETKFYFRHLSPEQQERFVALLNEKKLKIGFPGHFYRRPFFVSVKESA